MKICTLLLVVFLFGCHLFSQDMEDDFGIEVGERAPPFQLENLTGEMVELRSFLGEQVLLVFGTTWCGHCNAHKPSLQLLHQDYPQVVVLWINRGESRETVKDYMEGHGYTFMVLLDREQEVATTYQITANPTNIILDRGGVIKERIPGVMDYQLMKTLLNLL